MFSSCSFSVATLQLVITLLTATLALSGAATLGVSYGTRGTDLPRPREVVDLYKSQGIKAMRIYGPNQEILQALKGSDIELMLGVADEELQNLASGSSCAKRWVQTNVLNYLPDVKIKYIAVGNEITPLNERKQLAKFVLPAMRNIFAAVKDAGLFQKVRVSTTLDTAVIVNSFPPSKGEFNCSVMWYMIPIIEFLTETRAPIMFSVYPFFAYIKDPTNIKLPYVLFQNQCPEFKDNSTNLEYFNLFDAILDSVYSALEKASGSPLRGVHSVQKNGGGGSLGVVVTETGGPTIPWPPKRVHSIQENDEIWSIDNACTYNRNLIRHVTSSEGTPKRPGAPIETYIFSMFNENQKEGPEYERHFGLFYPNKTSVCGINFHET